MRGRDPQFRDALERQIFETILSFPERIDEMETRSEESCLQLARRIVDLLRQHGGPGDEGKRP